MADREKLGVGLSATALVAGLLTGTLLRPPSPPPEAKSAVITAPTARPEASSEASPLAQLRPVFTLMGQALGILVDPESQIAASSSVLADWEGKRSPVSNSVADLVAVLKQWPGATKDSPNRQRGGTDTCRPDLVRTLSRIGARSGSANDGKVPKPYPSKVLLADLEKCADQLALEALVNAVVRDKVDVQFLIAAVPDYVDSSSGWRADQVVDAIQSAMSENNFVLEIGSV